MTIREALEDLMAGRGGGIDPAAVLEAYGFDDLSPNTLSAALGHFAERAPLDVADTLAPIVTRLSEIPFLDGDLPSAADADAILADGGGIFDLLSQLDSISNTGEGSDPSDFDFGEDLNEDVAEKIEQGLDDLETEVDEDGLSDALSDVIDGLEDTFGSGEHHDPADLDSADEHGATHGLDDYELPVSEAPAIDNVEEHQVEDVADDLVHQLTDHVEVSDDIDPDDFDFSTSAG